MTHRPYHALRYPEFRRLWAAQLVSTTGSQMQSVALHWHVYLLTHSPLALGMVGLTRVIPIIVFSLGGGLLADRADRKKVIFATQATMALLSAVLAGLTFAGRETVVGLYALNALLAAASAFDNPARAALIPRLVPREHLPGALSLNLTMFQTALIVGPGLAGLLIAGHGAGIVGAPAHLEGAGAGTETTVLALLYSLNALSFVAVLAALMTMRTSGAVEGEGGVHEPPLAALRAGLRFVLTTPIMVWSMGLDFFATFFAGSMSLLPIFADQVLHVGAAGYGWLVAAPAVGALVGSLYTSVWPLPRRHGVVLLWSVAAYGVATIVYGLSRSFVLTLVALGATGLADLVSTVIRQTLRQLLTPDHLRGRMTSVNMIFFVGGPQLGEMEAGLVASLFGAVVTGVTVSVVSGGLATLAIAAVVAAATPLVRRYEPPLGGPPPA
jgi:MFS family permease